MEYLLHIMMYLCVAVGVSSHADSVGELYWKTVLPNTRMPNAIKSLLTSDQSNGLKASSSSLSSLLPSSPFDNKIGGHEKPEENVQSEPHYPFDNRYAGQKEENYHHYHPLNYRYADSKSNGAPPSPDNPFDYRYADSKSNGAPPSPDNPFDYRYADSKSNGEPPNPYFINYRYAGRKPLKRNSNITIFFLQKDLHLGTKLTLHFAKNRPVFSSSFLPRQISDSIPFSSSKFPEVFTRLSVKPESREAQFIKDTINYCEEPPIKGEDQLCVTSLEAMIDFSLSELGNITNNVEAISTETVNATTRQKYTINGVKKIGGDSSVICHKQKYPYAVFYCHNAGATHVFMVSLGGDHGGEAETATVCHQDTSAWNPNHMSFKLLNVHPGTAQICHFLPEGHVVWIKN